VKTVGLAGLMKMELPDPRDVLLCDGGFIQWGSETFRNADSVFGTLGSMEGLSEGIGDEVPALQISFLPPQSSAPGDLIQPGYQTARVRFWIAEYDVDAGTLDGTPTMVFDGQLDQMALEVDAAERRVPVSVVSTAERLFERNSGNSLNPTWHKSIWPGELGHDNATGLSIGVAWGTEKPLNTGTAYVTGSPGGGGGLGGGSEFGLNFYEAYR
jgi:hypothetical protein